ncbi:MAG: enoyl-CoA hydratase [Alphaproteobacteria bacterium]|nr:enoyl-CoA hydratase [Alphaproteobacteria bacterium]
MNAPTTQPARTAPILLEELGDDGILTLTLNRPDARNALSEMMLGALKAAFDRASVDPKTRVIVLAANGPAFCSGHDLKELTARRADPDKGRGFFEKTIGNCSWLMETIVRSPKAVIASVNGIATAAGCQLVAACDLAVAAESARFATPGVNIGLFCSTPMVALSRNLSRKHAMEMLLLGEMASAAEAQRFGLVNRVVPDSALRETARAMALTIAAKSTHTLKIGKEAFYAQAEMPLHDAYAYAGKVMIENMLAADAEEGIGAFLEKRPATWRDA